MTTVESKHSDAVTSTMAESAAPTRIAFGLDEAGKPHASWFGEADAPPAIKAVGLMAMMAIAATRDEHRTLASQLTGRRMCQGSLERLKAGNAISL